MSSISIRTGTEGPRHDPYSFTEITFTAADGSTVTAHYGLMVWLEDRDGAREHLDDKQLAVVFEDMTGMTLKQAERAHAKWKQLPYREHRKHGGMEWREGFPGEALCICKCGSVVDSTFNEEAIR